MLQISTMGMIDSLVNQPQLRLCVNEYINSSNSPTYITTNVATQYAQSAGLHVWSYAASGTAGTAISYTTAMTLDTSGRLGIGMTPTRTLDVTGTFGVTGASTLGGALTYGGVTLSNSVTGTGSMVLSASPTFSGSLTVTGVQTNLKMGNNGGNYNFVSLNGSFADGLAIGLVGGATADASVYLDSGYLSSTPGNIVFRLGGASAHAEAARFDASCNLLVGGTTNTTSAGICVNSTNGITVERVGSGYRQMYMATNVFYFYNGSNQASLSAAGAWTNASDARLKKNIETIGYGVDTVMALLPRQFDRVDVEGHYIGFVAQELQKIIPEAVSGEPEKQLLVDYGCLVSVAFKAIQELTTRLAALETK
jgi:hypothetical protein